jgi:hypothetical protein
MAGIPSDYRQGYSRYRDLGERRASMMRRPTRQIGGTAIILAFTLVACTPAATQGPASATPTGDVSIVGTWTCAPAGEPPPGREPLEISADGTVTIPQPQGDPLDLTWTVEGDRVSFQGPPGEAPDMATIESEDRMVFDDDSAFLPGGVCTRAS